VLTKNKKSKLNCLLFVLFKTIANVFPFAIAKSGLIYDETYRSILVRN